MEHTASRSPAGRNPRDGSRVGIDIGGTFTDLVVLDPYGRVSTLKVLSTPDDYARSILTALAALAASGAVDCASIGEVVHGTTVCTNAIVAGKGARTGLITTRGFRDTLEIGRMRYPRLHDLSWNKPVPLVERRQRMEVDERLDRAGQVVEPLDETSVQLALHRLLGLGVESSASRSGPAQR